MEERFLAPKPQDGKLWDVIVIGSGPAGLTAAIYTTRGAASTLIVGGSSWGGQLMLTTTVDNFPAMPGIQGPELMEKMKEHALLFGAEFLAEDVIKTDFSKRPFVVTTNSGKSFLSKSVIIATGARTKWLDVPGEERLRGRGVSSCAPCDAPFFKDKKVAVIGGGDSAMEEALVLTKYAKEVLIIHRRDKFRASQIMQKKVFTLVDKGVVKILWDTEVLEFIGEERLTDIRVKNNKTGEVSTIRIDGAFVAIGHEPASEIFSGQIERDEKGYIRVYERTKTNIKGVFVAGDVFDYTYKQAITAAGFGCMAAMDALSFLEENKT